MMEEDEEYHKEISVELARMIRELVPLEQKDMSLLVVGLGNREVTPDALGPNVVDQLFVTRHMIREFGTYALGEEHTNQISGIVPGVRLCMVAHDRHGSLRVQVGPDEVRVPVAAAKVVRVSPVE